MLTLLAWALLASAGGQTDCSKCKDAGEVVCPDDRKHACAGESALHCSIAVACQRCSGVRTVPCPRCGKKRPDARAAEREAKRVWLAALAPINAEFGRPLAHAESVHFRLTYDIPKLDIKGDGPLYDGSLHAGLHLYLERMEELHRRFSSDLGAAEEDYLGPTQVYLWSKKRDQEKAARLYTRQSSSTESKLMGAAPVVSIFYDKQWLHEEFELHQAVVHQVAHCLLSNVWDGIWPGNIRGGWLDEGLAHAYELALFGEVRHYCYIESDTILDIQRGAWEPPVRNAVERGKAPGFLGVTGKNTTELLAEEQIFAWSYVDFIRRAHPQQLGPVARAVKSRKPIRVVLAETLEISPFQFQELWEQWVKDNYALKEKKGRKRKRR